MNNVWSKESQDDLDKSESELRVLVQCLNADWENLITFLDKVYECKMTLLSRILNAPLYLDLRDWLIASWAKSDLLNLTAVMLW